MTLYKINGNLVSENTKCIKKEILDQMKATDEIVLDFSDTNYIDSIGLGMLVSIYKASINQKTNLRIKNVNENIKKILELQL